MTSPYREAAPVVEEPKRWQLLWCVECQSETGSHADACPSVLRSMTWWQRARRAMKGEVKR